jgi:hypothetical protein
MEGESGLEEAGPLPLAEDGRFPEANLQFLAHLKAQALGLAQAAMATAMAAGRSMGEDPSAQGAAEPAATAGSGSGGPAPGRKAQAAPKGPGAAGGATSAKGKVQPARR